MTENEAYTLLFLTILENNGYYIELRNFMKEKGYNLADMATMLNNSYEDIPDGMSPYFYMDSLEDMLSNQGFEEFNDINDMVEFVYDHMLWKA